MQNLSAHGLGMAVEPVDLGHVWRYTKDDYLGMTCHLYVR